MISVIVRDRRNQIIIKERHHEEVASRELRARIQIEFYLTNATPEMNGPVSEICLFYLNVFLQK